MKNQYWYSIHAKADETQRTEEDDRLRAFLTEHHVDLARNDKNVKMTLMELIWACFNGCKAERSMLFFRLKYNSYTRLPDTPKYYFGVYGMRGHHKFEDRATGYTNCYVGEDSVLMGTGFFDYIFDSYYLSEREARVESVKPLLDEKVKQNKKKEQRMDLRISEKDRMLICRIVERLWSCQLEKAATRFVISMDNQDIHTRSMEILKQIYMLLPQQLRLNMGFCTSSTLEDMRTLTEKYGLPVHIFTMSSEETEKLKAEMDNFKNPIEIFDVESIDRIPCDAEKLNLLLELSEKITPSSDAKIAYAEKSILNDTMGNLVSFKNMQSILAMVNKEDFCWWDRKDLDKIEDVCRLCMDQKEMMQIDVLHEEALNTFYTKLLPWKDYAMQIAEAVADDHYPNRQEILGFFSDELQFAKVIEAMQALRGNLETKAAEHEQKAVAGVQASWEADVAQRQQRHQAALAEKDRECSRLRDEKTRNMREYEQLLKKQDEKFAAERTARDKELETALKNEADKRRQEIAAAKEAHKEELDAEKERSSREIGKLNSKIAELQNTDANRELQDMQDKLNKSEEQKANMHRQAETAERQKKLFLITTIAAGSVAVIFLVLTIMFAIKGAKSGELTQVNKNLESEMEVLRSEKEGWQSKQAELESKVSSLQDENTALESEKKVLESTQQETEAESQTGEVSVGKALVVYYTYAKGSTKAVAEEIQKQTGADIFEIKTEEEYPSDYDSVIAKLQDDYANNVEYHLKDSIDNLDEYDTIFLGYPVWISTMPKAMGAFLYKYDLSGKTVVPFCTYDSVSSGAGETESQIQEVAPEANFKEMLEISDSHISDTDTESESAESESESTESEGESDESGSGSAEEGTSEEIEEGRDVSEFTEEVSGWLTGLGLLK